MNFKNLVLAGTAMFVVYKVGMMTGYYKCFNQLMDKYGEELLENHGEIVSKLKIGRNSTFTMTKKSK